MIPPAWEEVWICPSPDGHIQATARDARGRKQYRYHPRWREVRDDAKYDRMLAFGAALPRSARAGRRDLALPGPAAREGAGGGRAAARDDAHPRRQRGATRATNGSFGLTTLRNRHAEVAGARIRFRFRGKSEEGAPGRASTTARLARDRAPLPGAARPGRSSSTSTPTAQPQSIGSGDVNAYLQEITGRDFTAKDFRTWAGTVAMTKALGQLEPPASESAAKRAIVAAIADVAARLGNTPAVCRRCYVHPLVLEAYRDGTLAALARRRPRPGRGLRADEAMVLALLRRRSAA